jgi:hypothetical protein
VKKDNIMELSNPEELKEFFKRISVVNGVEYLDCIYMLEVILEKVLYGKYTVSFDQDFNIIAVNRETRTEIWIKGLKDIKKIRQSIYKRVKAKQESPSNMQSYISMETISELFLKALWNASALETYRNNKFSLHKNIKGIPISKTDDAYIVNIGGIAARLPFKYSDMQFEEVFGETFEFYVREVGYDTEEGTFSMILSRTTKNFVRNIIERELGYHAVVTDRFVGKANYVYVLKIPDKDKKERLEGLIGEKMVFREVKR